MEPRSTNESFISVAKSLQNSNVIVNQRNQYQTITQAGDSVEKSTEFSQTSDLLTENYDLSKKTISVQNVKISQPSEKSSSYSHAQSRQRYTEISKALQDKTVTMGKIGQFFQEVLTTVPDYYD